VKARVLGTDLLPKIGRRCDAQTTASRWMIEMGVSPSGSTTHIPVWLSGELPTHENHFTRAQGYLTPSWENEKKSSTQATSRPHIPSIEELVLTKIML
jgi:hypothetical protein